jgi:hypothetical protein
MGALDSLAAETADVGMYGYSPPTDDYDPWDNAEQLRGALAVSKLNTDVFVSKLNGTPLSCGMIFDVDWKPAERPVP